MVAYEKIILKIIFPFIQSEYLNTHKHIFQEKSQCCHQKSVIVVTKILVTQLRVTPGKNITKVQLNM